MSFATKKRRWLLSGLFAMSLGLSTAAQAFIIVGPDTEFAFYGTCSDCSGEVSGTVVLSNFTADSPLSFFDFVSFTYDGSNLLNPFTVDSSAPGLSLSGTLSADGTVTTDFNLAFNALTVGSSQVNQILVQSDGSWFVGLDDQGTNGGFAAVPAPSTAVLLALGLVGAGAARRHTRPQ